MIALPPDGRPNYFDGQDLGADDLIAERATLDALRRIYNTTLHTTGIAHGLDVRVGDDRRSLWVDAGLAIQTSGQEALLGAARRLPVPPLATGAIDLFIQSTVDRTPCAGSQDGGERLVHVTDVVFVSSGDAVDPDAVFLASVALADDGTVRELRAQARRLCGFALGQLSFKDKAGAGRARLACDVEDDDAHLTLAAEAVVISGVLGVAGGLRIGGRRRRALLDIAGDGPVLLAIQDPDAAPILVVDDAGGRIGPVVAATAGRLIVAGSIAMDAGRSLLFDGDGGLASGGSASGGSDHAIDFRASKGDGPGLMTFREAGRIELRSGSTTPDAPPTMTLLAGGEVGIGVSAPTNALEVDGSIQSLAGGFDFGDGTPQRTAAISTCLPIGGIVEWWSGGGVVPLPAEYSLCDGSPITDPKSPLRGHATPDLVGSMVRGTSDYADIGVTGGATTHVHAIEKLPPHTHSIVHLHPSAKRQTGDSIVDGKALSTDSKCCHNEHSHAFTFAIQDCPQTTSMANDGQIAAVATEPASSLPSSMGLAMIMRIR